MAGVEGLVVMLRFLLITGVVLGVITASASSGQAQPAKSTPVPVTLVIDATPGCTTHHTYLRAVTVEVTRSAGTWTTRYRDDLSRVRVEAQLLGVWIPVPSKAVDGGLLTVGIYGRWRLVTPSPWGDVTGPPWEVTHDLCSSTVDNLRWAS